jgi:hypothetical protein
MILSGNILYLDKNDIELASISFETARRWSFKIKDPLDRRCDLYPYEQFADKYKALIVEKFGNPYEYYSKTLVKQFLKADQKAFNFYSTYPVSNGVGLPETHITKYTLAAKWLNLLVEMDNQTKGFKAKYTITREQFWNAVTSVIAAENIDLPTSERRLKPKVKEYQELGYECLIKGFGNTRSKKITDQGERWLIASFGSPIKKLSISTLYLQYNDFAISKGWKTLKSEETLRVFLNRPEVKKQWYGMRYGELKAKEKYGYTLKTDLPTFRDALWYSDGTKLNFYYMAASGMVAKMQVYEVIDAYSEFLLGYHISESENFEAQYNAYRYAVMTAQARPYELKYDNQGGHSKLKNGDFLNKIAKISVNTQPYNGKSKTIESAFGRFQSQIMSEYWFFTGQNVQSKKEESKANLEFINANKKNLPSLSDAIKIYEECRNKWNASINNSIGMPRKAAYYGSVNPQHMAVDYLQMVDLFWITKELPVTYYTSGISTDINKVNYEFEVLDGDGMPNTEFRDLYIGQKFIIKYDPNDFSHVRLYIDKGNGVQFVAIAQPRLSVPRAKQSHQPGDAKKIHDLLQVRETERINDLVRSSHILFEEGLLPEQNGLNTPLPKGISKRKVSDALALAGLEDIIPVKIKKSKVSKDQDDYGVMLKEQSNQSPDVLDLW